MTTMSVLKGRATLTSRIQVTQQARPKNRVQPNRAQLSRTTTLLTVLLLIGCNRLSVQELQSRYIQCADELELQTQDLIALRDEIAEVWDFAIKQKRANKLKIAIQWMHKNDPDARLKKLLDAVGDVQTRLQDLGRYSTDSTHKQWHDDLAEIFSMFDLGVTNARDVPRGTLTKFKEETEQLRVDLLTRLSALSITLKVPTS